MRPLVSIIVAIVDVDIASSVGSVEHSITHAPSFTPGDKFRKAWGSDIYCESYLKLPVR